jgi:hypothetical protein
MRVVLFDHFRKVSQSDRFTALGRADPRVFIVRVPLDHALLTHVGPRSSGASSSRNSSPRRRSDFTDVEDMETEDELRDDVNPFDSPDAGVNKARRGSSASRSISMARDDDLGLPRHTSVYGYPGSTWSMSGPFPSPNRTSSIRPDTSPMYDIRSSDYFTVDTPASGKEGRRGSFTNGSGSTGKRDSSVIIVHSLFLPSQPSFLDWLLHQGIVQYPVLLSRASTTFSDIDRPCD